MGSSYRSLHCGTDCVPDYSDVLDGCVSWPARNTPELREKANQYQAGETSREDYDHADTLKCSELSNMSFYTQSVGEVAILAVIVGNLFGLNGSFPSLYQFVPGVINRSFFSSCYSVKVVTTRPLKKTIANLGSRIVDASTANRNWGLSVLIAFTTGVWLLLAIPWFFKEKRRAGQEIPSGMK